MPRAGVLAAATIGVVGLTLLVLTMRAERAVEASTSPALRATDASSSSPVWRGRGSNIPRPTIITGADAAPLAPPADVLPPRLVYDIGFNNGGDTAAYLGMGYQVVAVEASSELVAKGRKRFRKEIESGQLRLLHRLLVSDQVAATGKRAADGTMTLWVNDNLHVWSSFHKDVGCRRYHGSTKCHPEQVEVVTCGELLRHYGRSTYAKIDVEGVDEECLASMLAQPARIQPVFVSIELGHEQGKEGTALRWLERAGYDGFKLVCQYYYNGNSSPFGSFANNALTIPKHKSDGEGFGFEWSSAKDIRAHLPSERDKELARRAVANLVRKDRLKKGRKNNCWYDLHARRPFEA